MNLSPSTLEQSTVSINVNDLLSLEEMDPSLGKLSSFFSVTKVNFS